MTALPLHLVAKQARAWWLLVDVVQKMHRGNVAYTFTIAYCNLPVLFSICPSIRQSGEINFWWFGGSCLIGSYSVKEGFFFKNFPINCRTCVQSYQYNKRNRDCCQNWLGLFFTNCTVICVVSY